MIILLTIGWSYKKKLRGGVSGLGLYKTLRVKFLMMTWRRIFWYYVIKTWGKSYRS
jgi:hypothetical protein